MESVIEPELDSVAGNIEIAIYMATEIENALADITQNNEKRINTRVNQLHANRKTKAGQMVLQAKAMQGHIITTSYSSCI